MIQRASGIGRILDRSTILQLSDRIASEFAPERIILFGSYANGTPTPDSDVDLLVVMPFDGKGWRVATEIRARLRPDFPLDLVVRTPEQIQERQQLDDPFIEDILLRGRVLYEADHQRVGRQGGR